MLVTPTPEPSEPAAEQQLPIPSPPLPGVAASPINKVVATSASEILHGTDQVDLFKLDNTQLTGTDRIIDFDQNDLFATKNALELGSDGYVRLSDHSIFGLGSSKDVLSVDGLSKTGVRYLGETADGHIYANALARPGGAKEGLLGVNDTLNAGDAKDKVLNKFFVDNAIDQHLGNDKVQNFGSRDVVITSALLGSDVKGSHVSAVNGSFALTHDGLDLGSLAVTDTGGHAVDTLEYAGILTSGAMHWYVYDAVGSTAGDALVG